MSHQEAVDNRSPSDRRAATQTPQYEGYNITGEGYFYRWPQISPLTPSLSPLARHPHPPSSLHPWTGELRLLGLSPEEGGGVKPKIILEKWGHMEVKVILKSISERLKALLEMVYSTHNPPEFLFSPSISCIVLIWFFSV